jgi:hypothetical protein
MKRALPALLCAAALGVACQTEDPTANATSIPTTPVNPTVETFTGSVPVKGLDAKPFVIALSGGTVTVTLTTVTPTMQMTLGVGNWTAASASCTPFQNGGGSIVTSPSAVPQLSGTLTSGSYCLLVGDSGTGAQTTTVTYSAIVSHY